MRIKISETFETIQGEGCFAGAPSLFIRTSGCNLRCWWCDTPYTSWTPEGRTMDASELIQIIAQSRMPHVVITGGEPMLFSELVAELIAACDKQGCITTVETNGTIWDSRVIPVLFSVSPKMPSSSPRAKALDTPLETIMHERNNTDKELSKFAELDHECVQFKYVIDNVADVDFVQAQLDKFSIPASSVWAMPQGITKQEVLEKGAWLAEVCKERSWNLCLRQHILLWGNKRGV